MEINRIFDKDPPKSKLQIRRYDPNLIPTITFIDSMITPDSFIKQCNQCKYNLDTIWFIENPNICHMCIQDNQAKEEE